MVVANEENQTNDSGSTVDSRAYFKRVSGVYRKANGGGRCRRNANLITCLVS